MKRRSSRSRRGMTLIEAVVATGVLTAGAAAVFGMIVHVQGANRSTTFQTNALDAFSRLAAQVRDAQCDYRAETFPPLLDAATTDPGLAGAVGGAWVTAPLPNSTVTALGDANTNPGVFARYVPPMRVDYRVLAEGAVDGPPAFRVDVRVRELTRDPVRDALALVDGAHIRVFPVQKVCNPRIETGRGRGEYR